MGCRQTRELSYGRMFTKRFLNLLQGRLAVMKREVCALELASLWGMRGREVAGQGKGAGASAIRSQGTYLFYICAYVEVSSHAHPSSVAPQSP